jgi:Fe2+ transport system protein FeoA
MRSSRATSPSWPCPAPPSSTDPDVIAFLDTLGLRPGVTVEVREKHPFDGPLVLVVDGRDRTVGEKVARQIYVRKEPRKETA